jgi:RNase H-fold protein (predicted Holliday junction resolvase)
MTDNEITVIAVDPGREKCGIAVVTSRQGVLRQQVISTVKLAETAAELAENYRTNTVVIGNRTSSRSAIAILQQVRVNDAKLNIIPVDEHHSTEEARKRYWGQNPPRGLARIIPVTMRVPPVPVDDFVAVILAERYYNSLK